MQKPSYLDLVTQAPCILTESLSLQRAKRPCKMWRECLGLRLCGCDLVNFNVYQYLLPHFFHSMVATTLFFCPLSKWPLYEIKFDLLLNDRKKKKLMGFGSLALGIMKRTIRPPCPFAHIHFLKNIFNNYLYEL